MATDQELLEQIVRTWSINPLPEYRAFRCANCQQQCNEAYYHWLVNERYVLPVHFCASCQSLLKRNQLDVTAPPGKPVAPHAFSDRANQAFRDIVANWKQADSDKPTAYYCDACQGTLDIDSADNQRKGYHVWWQQDGTWHELHFDRQCGDTLLGS